MEKEVCTKSTCETKHVHRCVSQVRQRIEPKLSNEWRVGGHVPPLQVKFRSRAVWLVCPIMKAGSGSVVPVPLFFIYPL